MTTSWYDEPLDDLVCKYFLTMYVRRQSVSLKLEACHTVISLGNGKCCTIFPIDNDEHLLNIFISYLQTALHWAAKKGRNDLVEILINTEMDVNLKSVRHQFLCVNNVPISFFLMHNSKI